MVRAQVYATCDRCRHTYAILTVDASKFGDFKLAVESELKRDGWGRQIKSVAESEDICPDCMREAKQ